jgi:CubicO group peptidase (beta-lactamase class C family)
VSPHTVNRTLHALSRLVLVVVLLAVMLAAASVAAARTTDYAATIKDGRAAANALLEQSGAPSLSLALVSGDRVVWQEGFGYADTATSTAPQADTMYGIGSVSKMLATVAAMKLVDQGKLGLDTPLVHYLPALGARYPVYGQVTVRMLLDHSGGFPGTTYGDSATGVYFPGYLQQVLDAIATERPKTTPGYMSVYCNDGFTLVEALVPAVTGKTYAEYVQDEILTPLGMEHSAYPLHPFAEGSYAKAYEGDVALPQEVLNVLASGALYSTPSDMSRLAQMLMNGGVYRGTRILSADAVSEMGTDQTLLSFDPVPNDALRYGLGWDTVTEPGLKAVGVAAWAKGGDADDYHAGFIVAPKARLAVTVTALAPLNSAACDTLGQRILLHALVDQGTLRRMPKPIPAKAPPVKTAGAAQLAAMEGYWAMNEMVFRVTAAASDPQALTLWALAGDEWRPLAEGMRLRSDGRYHLDGKANSGYTVAAGGRRYLVTRSVGSNGHYLADSLFAQKLPPLPALSAAWQSRVGHTWLAVNEQPDSDTYEQDGGAVLAIGVIPGIQGYVTVATSAYPTQVVDPSESDSLGSMFLQIPGTGSRDLEDAVVTRHGAEEWIQFGATLYRPQATVPALPSGSTTVTFGSEGYAEWRALPAAAQVQIDGGASWRLYDAGMAVLDGGTTTPAAATAPTAGCSLLLFGAAGSTVTVTVTAG